jgi:hypothetical protein
VAARLDSRLYLNLTMQVLEVIGQFSDFESESEKGLFRDNRDLTYSVGTIIRP